MDTNHLSYEVADSIAQITMGRAPVNAITHEFSRQLNEAYRRAKNDPDVRAVVLTSDFEKAFSAGSDMNMSAAQTGADKREYLETLYFEMHDLQYRMGKPTIAAVTGPAMGAGVTLSVACNCIIASEDAEFGYPEITVGVLPAMHIVHLPRQIGRHKAFELLFSGEPISATDAEALGIINKAVPAEDVLDEAIALAGKFAAHAPEVMKVAHNAFMRANDTGYRQNIEWVVDSHCFISESSASQEGRDAFVEDRDPAW